MQPVREAYWLSEDWRRRNLRYFPFYGRGYVQLTWQANYQKASELYGVDFVADPDLALDPKWSIQIIFDGMRDGWFTARDLDDFIDNVDDEDLREFANARRIVNGTDRQVEIGKLALAFEGALKRPVTVLRRRLRTRRAASNRDCRPSSWLALSRRCRRRRLVERSHFMDWRAVLMLGPISRILLRYIAGALIIAGWLTADMGHMLAEDPDVVSLVQWALSGIAATAAAEVGYWLAKRWGWRT